MELHRGTHPVWICPLIYLDYFYSWVSLGISYDYATCISIPPYGLHPLEVVYFSPRLSGFIADYFRYFYGFALDCTSLRPLPFPGYLLDGPADHYPTYEPLDGHESLLLFPRHLWVIGIFPRYPAGQWASAPGILWVLWLLQAFYHWYSAG